MPTPLSPGSQRCCSSLARCPDPPGHPSLRRPCLPGHSQESPCPEGAEEGVALVGGPLFLCLHLPWLLSVQGQRPWAHFFPRKNSLYSSDPPQLLPAPVRSPLSPQSAEQSPTPLWPRPNPGVKTCSPVPMNLFLILFSLQACYGLHIKSWVGKGPLPLPSDHPAAKSRKPTEAQLLKAQCCLPSEQKGTCPTALGFNKLDIPSGPQRRLCIKGKTNSSSHLNKTGRKGLHLL